MKVLYLLVLITLSGCTNPMVSVINSQPIYDTGFADEYAVACHKFSKDDSGCPMSKY